MAAGLRAVHRREQPDLETKELRGRNACGTS